jgi:hypothetical protein
MRVLRRLKKTLSADVDEYCLNRGLNVELLKDSVRLFHEQNKLGEGQPRSHRMREMIRTDLHGSVKHRNVRQFKKAKRNRNRVKYHHTKLLSHEVDIHTDPTQQYAKKVHSHVHKSWHLNGSFKQQQPLSARLGDNSGRRRQQQQRAGSRTARNQKSNSSSSSSSSTLLSPFQMFRSRSTQDPALDLHNHPYTQHSSQTRSKLPRHMRTALAQGVIPYRLEKPFSQQQQQQQYEQGHVYSLDTPLPVTQTADGHDNDDDEMQQLVDSNAYVDAHLSSQQYGESAPPPSHASTTNVATDAEVDNALALLDSLAGNHRIRRETQH